MDSEKLLQEELIGGNLIRLVYCDQSNVDKIAFLFHGKFYKKIYPKRKIDKNLIYDICNDGVFKTDGITLKRVHCLITTSKESYVDLKKIKQSINTIKKEYNDYVSNEFSYYENLSSTQANDKFYLRFYPQKLIQTENIKDMIYEDIKQKYFVINLEESEISSVSALRLLGISEKNFNIEEEEFINAAKRMWFNYIKIEIDDIVNRLKKTFSSEKEEYDILLAEVEQFESMVNRDCEEKFKDLKTIKSIISYWPELLQPKPCFVYED